jgi:ABC-type molybdate transport system ATPase subunit
MVTECRMPVLTVSQDVYDEILRADRVMVVAEGRAERVHEVGEGLPNFFSVRQCFLTSAQDAPAALLRLMVGG